MQIILLLLKKIKYALQITVKPLKNTSKEIQLSTPYFIKKFIINNDIFTLWDFNPTWPETAIQTHYIMGCLQDLLYIKLII